MPKLIDYPRTTYSGAWELSEVVDDTGGKCTIETAARKLDRKVSGSFKAIIGSAVKFGLMTSKRELLSTTALFKRIKHAYDKQEELQFHREAFLTPPLFTQICRKFRGKELPIQMLDVILIREFSVEEINAQGVAKAFVEGARMCTILDERNVIADIDALNAQRPPRREIASPTPSENAFGNKGLQYTNQLMTEAADDGQGTNTSIDSSQRGLQLDKLYEPKIQNARPLAPTRNNDAIANLFGFAGDSEFGDTEAIKAAPEELQAATPATEHTISHRTELSNESTNQSKTQKNATAFQVQIIGPGINTSLEVTHEDDIKIAIALLEKIRRELHADE